jgi:flagellin
MSITVGGSVNNTALIALQDLTNTANQLTQAQDVTSTGLQVASPKDSPAIWAIAQNQKGEISTLDSVTASLGRATSISDVAIAGGQSVINLLNQLKQTALSATDSSLDTTSRQALNSDFQNTLAQITATVNNAGFDGVNLLDGSASTGVNVLASASGADSLTLSGANLALGGSVITLGSTASLGSVTAATAAMSQIGTSLANLTSALSNLGVQANQIADQTTSVSQLSDSLQTGVGALVNANMGAESARLQALQVQQQLGAQSLSIANQIPSVILSLFR